MDKKDIYKKCTGKAEELLDKYYHNYLLDAAVLRPEILEPEYNLELPRKVEAEFNQFLAILWKELTPQSGKTYEAIMNQHLNMAMSDAEYIPHLKKAKAEAEKNTLWEKITKTNHEDVTHYKGLLIEYTQKVLDNMIEDFIEDINNI